VSRVRLRNDSATIFSRDRGKGRPSDPRPPRNLGRLLSQPRKRPRDPRVLDRALIRTICSVQLRRKRFDHPHRARRNPRRGGRAPGRRSARNRGPRRGAHSRRVAARRSLGLRHRTRPALGLRDRLRRPGRVRAARLRLASQACDIGSLGVGGRATARTSPKPQSGPHVNRRRRDGWSAVCGVRPAMVRSSMEVSRPTTIAAQRREQPQLAYRRPHRGSAGPGSGSLAHRTGC
jgi:hypothetical protein